MDFDVAFERLIGHEGGYVNNPSDPGGETKFGISRRAYPSEMIRRTVELIREDKIDGISNIENLSSEKSGTKIVYELKRDAVANVVLNKLYQYTSLQSSYSVNNVALVNGRPMSLNLKDMISEFVKHRHQVVVRRSEFELNKALERAHILEGLLKALDIIDEIIAIIRASKTVNIAIEELISKYDFSDKQAAAIVEMKLRQLVGLERERLQAEVHMQPLVKSSYAHMSSIWLCCFETEGRLFHESVHSGTEA